MASRSPHTTSGESRAAAVDSNPSCAAKVKSSTSSSRGLNGGALGAQAGATGLGKGSRRHEWSKGGRRRAEPSYGRQFGPRLPLRASERVGARRMPVALTGHGGRRRRRRDGTRKRPSRLPAFPGTRTERGVAPPMTAPLWVKSTLAHLCNSGTRRVSSEKTTDLNMGRRP